MLSRLDRGRLTRYAAVAVIAIAIGGAFVQRELLRGGDGTTVAEAPSAIGMLERHAPKVGEVSPDFALATPDGRVIRLSDFRGKTVVLNFWATWCPPCRAEMPDFQRAWEARGGATGDLVVLAVNLEEPAGPVAAFVAEFGITFPVVLDRAGSVAPHYGLRGLPGTFFIDRAGVLRGQSLGPVFGELLPQGIASADREGATSR